MDRAGRRRVIKPFLWTVGALLSLFVVVFFLMVDDTPERRAVESMAFPIALSATSVRDAYPEVRSLALSIREDFLVTWVIYRPLDHEAQYRFQAPGRPYMSDIVALWLHVDTSEWVVLYGEVSYGSEQSRVPARSSPPTRWTSPGTGVAGWRS